MMKKTSTDERGQVGIGTLIVFIAMVLVAAIAAGVLINTAGFLQTQAEATGEESTQQVADQVQVMDSTGLVVAGNAFDTGDDFAQGDVQDNDVYQIEMTLQKSPGAGSIDLSDATLEYLAADARTLTYGGQIHENEEDVFLTQGIGDSDDEVLVDNDDRVEIIILLGGPQSDANEDFEFVEGSTDVDAANTPGVLSEGDEVELVITTSSGAQTQVNLRTPNIIDANEDSAVRL
ncbi:archaellin/type IV pilin N-terminal domain-containing protein [Natrarchaeobius sp. A-rgal3]|uniref:archaellin/type IV pilin N-terminal domain-containing protein n=1 Tax=Natrarchaeobius versutus TaxID=1679078 RepID=UPI003510832A